MSSRRSSRRSLERSACPAGRTSTAVIAPGGVAIGSQPRYSGSPLSRRCQGGRWSSGSWVPSRRSPTVTGSAAPAGRCSCWRSCSSTGAALCRPTPRSRRCGATRCRTTRGTPCRPSSHGFAARSARTRCSSARTATGWRTASSTRSGSAGWPGPARTRSRAASRPSGDARLADGTRALARRGARGRPLRAVRRRRSPSGSRRSGWTCRRRADRRPARPRAPPRAASRSCTRSWPSTRCASRCAASSCSRSIAAGASPTRSPPTTSSAPRSATSSGSIPRPSCARSSARSCATRPACPHRGRRDATSSASGSTCARPAPARRSTPSSCATSSGAATRRRRRSPGATATRRSSCSPTGSPWCSAPPSPTRTTLRVPATSRASCSMRSPVSPASWNRTTSISRSAPASRPDPR